MEEYGTGTASKPGPSASKPLLRLRGVALWATAIATGVPGETLGVALLETPDLANERRGAAVEDVFDGATRCVEAASTRRREPRGR